MNDLGLQRTDELLYIPALHLTKGKKEGVDSGLPDFRSDNGFCRAYPALGKARIQFQKAGFDSRHTLEYHGSIHSGMPIGRL